MYRVVCLFCITMCMVSTAFGAQVSVPYPPTYQGTIRSSEMLANLNALAAGINDITDAQVNAGANINGSKLLDTSVGYAKIGSDVRAIFASLQAHVASTTAIHGITSGFVGVSDTQTLTNKTLSGGTVSGATLSGTTTNSGTMSGGTVTGVTVSNSTIGSTNSIDGGAVKSGTVADARVDAALARDSEVTTAVTNHNNVTNPHSATNANTASRIVMRDASGNFSAGTITADLTGNVTGNVSGSSGSCTGNAATATKLASARTLNVQDADGSNTGTGASFDGSGNATIKLPSTIKASITGNVSGSSGSCTGNAATATKLASARTLNVQDADGSNTGTGASFDGSGNATIKLPSTIKASITGNVSGTAANVTGVVADANIASTIARDSEYIAADSAVLSAANASDALLLRLDGSRVMTGNLKFSAGSGITVNATDAGYSFIAGGTIRSVNNGADIRVFGNQGANPGFVQYNAGNVSTGHHVFYTGAGLERMRLTYGGNLLIGTTSDDGANKLQVNGNLKVFGSSHTYSRLYRTSTSHEALLYFVSPSITDSTPSWRVGYDSILGSAYNFSISTHGTADAVTSRFVVTPAGNVLIGTTTDDGTNKLQVNGGIKGATLTTTGAGVIGGDLTVTGASTNFLSAMKAVDGSGSGLDADYIDGRSSATIWGSDNDGQGSGLVADMIPLAAPSTPTNGQVWLQ